MSVLEAPTVKDGTFVKVLPYQDDVESVKGDLIDALLRYIHTDIRHFCLLVSNVGSNVQNIHGRPVVTQLGEIVRPK